MNDVVVDETFYIDEKVLKSFYSICKYYDSNIELIDEYIKTNVIIK